MCSLYVVVCDGELPVVVYVVTTFMWQTKNPHYPLAKPEVHHHQLNSKSYKLIHA